MKEKINKEYFDEKFKELNEFQKIRFNIAGYGKNLNAVGLLVLLLTFLGFFLLFLSLYNSEFALYNDYLIITYIVMFFVVLIFCGLFMKYYSNKELKEYINRMIAENKENKNETL